MYCMDSLGDFKYCDIYTTVSCNGEKIKSYSAICWWISYKPESFHPSCLNLLVTLSIEVIVEISVWNRCRENGNVAFSLDYALLEEIEDVSELPVCVISP